MRTHSANVNKSEGILSALISNENKMQNNELYKYIRIYIFELTFNLIIALCSIHFSIEKQIQNVKKSQMAKWCYIFQMVLL